MGDSILTSTKKVLGIAEDYEEFDLDILMHINSVFSTLNQLGIGPELGFMVEDKEATWAEFIGDDLRFNSIRTYVYLKVRMLFDPPTTSYLIAAMERQTTELEWRLNVLRESYAWADPDPDLDENEDLVIDGGAP